MADILELSRSNISIKISEIAEEFPDAVFEKMEGGAKMFRFDFSKLEEAEVSKEAELPDWMHQKTYDGILGKLGPDLADSYALQFEPIKWVDQFQRGGVVITGREEGQKHPEWRMTLRIDNCVVVDATEREGL